MSYVAATDFLALVRKTPGGARIAQIPGLDFVVSALSRANMFKLWIGQTAPIIDQEITAWLRPSSPSSWAAEGVVFLWNADAQEYQFATPALWARLLLGVANSYVLQVVTVPAVAVDINTSIVVVDRTAPAATALGLPTVASRGGQPLRVADWSTGVVDHGILLTAAGGDTIMRLGSYTVYSNAVQLSGVTLQPVTELNGWIIAP